MTRIYNIDGEYYRDSDDKNTIIIYPSKQKDGNGSYITSHDFYTAVNHYMIYDLGFDNDDFTIISDSHGGVHVRITFITDESKTMAKLHDLIY